MNNLNTRFRTIQRRARALLAEHRGVDLAKVPWEVGCLHDLRRTYGTEMARHVPIHVLCAWMGHASMQTTREFYLGIDERDAEAGRAALEGLYVQTDAQLTRDRVEDESAGAPGDSNRRSRYRNRVLRA